MNAYTINTYMTQYTGQVSERAFQLFYNGAPQAREVGTVEEAFEQAREAFRVTPSYISAFFLNEREPFVPVIEVETGQEVHRVYVERKVLA